MEQVGKVLCVLGILLIVLGLAVWGIDKLGFRGLPGDIRYESEHFSFYFPIVTCIMLSLALTLLAWLWQWWRK